MMADSRGRFRRQEVAARLVEKRHHGVILHDGAFATIDDHLSPASASTNPSPVTALTTRDGDAAPLRAALAEGLPRPFSR